MRKWIAMMLLAALTVLAAPALALTDEDLENEARQKVEAGIALKAQEETGWARVMLGAARVTQAKKNGAYVVVTVAFPDMRAGVESKEKPGDDPAGYLSRAIEPALSLTQETEYSLRVGIKGKGDGRELNWSDTRTLQGLMKKIGTKASAAAKTYATAQMKSALGAYLMPKAAQMPKRKPEQMPEMALEADYAAQAAQALGITPAQAQERLPAMLMLMEVSKVGAAPGLDSVPVTVKTKDWQAMLAQAEAAARAAMLDMMGVPDMPREEVEAILASQLPGACLDAYYNKKSVATAEMTVDLIAAVQKGAGSAGAVMDALGLYCDQWEAHVDSLMAYAATLDDYPKVPLIDTGILSGSLEDGGTQVFVDTGDSGNHGYICLKRGGATVATGFIHQGVRLHLPLAPGEYELYASWGPVWYGERYAFGQEAPCARVILTVPQGGNLRLSLQAAKDGAAYTPVDYQTFIDAVSAD